jgi:predicted nuclease with TOPRIM domain
MENMLDNLYHQLFNILENEYDNYIKLYQLSLKKRKILIQNQSSKLLAVVDKERTYLSSIKNNEQKLKSVFKKFKNKYPEMEFRISDLIKKSSHSKKEILKFKSGKLNNLITKLKFLNKNNLALLEKAGEINQLKLNFLMKSFQKKEETIYGQSTKKNGSSKNYLMDYFA